MLGLKTQTRQRTVKDVLQAKGLNPKIAAFVPADIDTSEEAINNWINEYGDVFGAVAQAETQPTQQSQDVTAQARINNMVATGQAPSLDQDSMSRVLQAKSRDELDALLGL